MLVIDCFVADSIMKTSALCLLITLPDFILSISKDIMKSLLLQLKVYIINIVKGQTFTFTSKTPQRYSSIRKHNTNYFSLCMV